MVNPVPEEQSPVSESVAAVQNDWYEIVSGVNCRLSAVCFMMETLAEDIELRITVENESSFTLAQAAAVAGTWYNLVRSPVGAYGYLIISGDASNTNGRSFIGEYRNVKVELRKTTANGANTLWRRATFSLW